MDKHKIQLPPTPRAPAQEADPETGLGAQAVYWGVTHMRGKEEEWGWALGGRPDTGDVVSQPLSLRLFRESSTLSQLQHLSEVYSLLISDS